MSLFRSLSFRLATTYALLFAASLAVLLGTYHWVSIKAPRDAVKAALLRESNAFAASYRAGDAASLARALEARAGEASPRAGFHLLLDPQGRTVTTNLPSWPRFAGAQWVSIEADIYRDGDEDDHEALAFDRQLADGSRLLVGRDVEDIDDIEEAIAGAARDLTLATILLVLLGAFLMNRAIARRIETVSSAARQVIGGDLTRRVAIRGSGDEFDRLADTLNLMLDRVEQANEGVRRVSDSVAHELRTPLAKLQANLAGLQHAPQPERAALIESAIGEAERLQAMFDAVLRIARIESGRHGARREPVDIGLLLADAADYYAPAAEDRGLALTVQAEPGLIIEGDADLLFQAIGNLIDNAVKFTPPGGRIDLAAQKGGDGIVVSVADTGPGIPAELRGRVTERFFRAAPGREAGFGLGLALVDAVAALHQSRLRFVGDGGLRVEWLFPFSRRRD